jgi:hypothetical protein
MEFVPNTSADAQEKNKLICEDLTQRRKGFKGRKGRKEREVGFFIIFISSLRLSVLAPLREIIR